MSRQLFILANAAVRKRVHEAIDNAVDGSRVTIQDPKRSLEQSAKMWAMLTDISEQHKHNDRYYTTEQWKAIFLNALGHEMQFVPTLDGNSFFPIGRSSADLSVKEMSDLLELMHERGAVWGVQFHTPDTRTPPSQRALAGSAAISREEVPPPPPGKATGE
jgi:predicted NUDIX family NTP pyrophosphohydrolase